MNKIHLSLLLVLLPWLSACAPAVPPELTASVPSASSPAPQDDPPLIVAAEEQAGFEVQSPAYLPPGVSLDSAALETDSAAGVVLRFKLVHEQFGDMGIFFLVRQQPLDEPPPAVPSCGEQAQGCEILQADGRSFVYRLHPSPAGDGADTESLEWYADGFFFTLQRTAGEPGQVYKDELLKVAGSIK